MNTKRHYESHLANFYFWMVGDFEKGVKDFKSFLEEQNVKPKLNKTALDLGSGNGMQSIAMKQLGFYVKAVDFSQKLLNELKVRPESNGIELVNMDITDVHKFRDVNPELVVCAGDTLTHLESKEQIRKFLKDCVDILSPKGHIVLTFRDYCFELKGDAKFIPVKSDENRIFTCILNYADDYVQVTDLLYERINGSWQQKVSTYEKTRISGDDVIDSLKNNNLEIVFNGSLNRMVHIVARKQ
ncbi:MAG: class I SAM-dependent methyltransferase [Bacteroidota bacterium]